MSANPKKSPNRQSRVDAAGASANVMWGGRFALGPDEAMERINASIDIDRRLYAQDIAASKAHCKMLVSQGIVSEQDGAAILGGLDTISREIEAGQFVLNLDDYSLRDVVDNVVVSLGSLAQEKALDLTREVQGNLPMVHGDEQRITQVLMNLVGNAIKFTEEGGIVVKAGAANGSFQVSVRDSGIGISEADQRRIFEEFHQADDSDTRTQGGTGLGLAIAKRMVQMHGGDIWVESKPGRGTTVSFSLPVRAEARKGAA